MFDDVDSGALEKAMPWIIGACIVLVICLIAYLAAYFLL